MISIPAGNGHLKSSRPRLVPARPKVCIRHVRQPLRFPKQNETRAMARVSRQLTFELTTCQNHCRKSFFGRWSARCLCLGVPLARKRRHRLCSGNVIKGGGGQNASPEHSQPRQSLRRGRHKSISPEASGFQKWRAPMLALMNKFTPSNTLSWKCPCLQVSPLRALPLSNAAHVRQPQAQILALAFR